MNENWYLLQRLKLALKKRPRETRKWPIEVTRGIGAIQWLNRSPTHLEEFDGIGYLVWKELVISDKE